MELGKPNHHLRGIARTVGHALLRGAVSALGALTVQAAWQLLVG
ncbi:hypothetical protein ACXNSR_16200 [Streptomyces sp. NC-S4]